jgi:hypothetical protein
VDHGILEYGNAVKELIAANIFPGDMLYKNFGVTRHGRVVFYDYDEIEYLTDCNVRRVPAPRNEEEEMSGEVWYTVRPHDIFRRPTAHSCWAIRVCAPLSCGITPISLTLRCGSTTKTGSWPAMSMTFCVPQPRTLHPPLRPAQPAPQLKNQGGQHE